MEAVLGVDLGTTNSKACLFSLSGGLLAASSIRTPVHHDAQFGECHLAQDLWKAIASVIRDCVLKAKSLGYETVEVRALAVASFAEEGVCLDSSGEPVAPVIPWYDARTKEQVKVVTDHIDADTLKRLTGMPLDRSFSLCKLLWMKQYYPDRLQKTATFVPVSDYINLKLTGQLAVSPSLASRTMLYSPYENRWLGEICSEFSLSQDIFPPLLAGGQSLGVITADAAVATGLDLDTVVVVGGHDDACAALGAGVINPGSGLLSSGTAEAIYVIAPAAYVETQSPSLCIGRDATGEKTYLSDFVSTGALLRWTVEHLQIAKTQEQKDVYKAFAKAAVIASQKGDSERLEQFTFERNPISLSSFAWSGLRLETNADDMLVAVMHETTHALWKILDEIQRVIGYAMPSLIACGGLSTIPEYVAFKEQQLGCRLSIHPYTELTAGGAAVLAAKGSHYFSSFADAVSTLLEREE